VSDLDPQLPPAHLALLARLDERTASIQNEVGLMRSDIKMTVDNFNRQLESQSDRTDSKFRDFEIEFEKKVHDIEQDLQDNYIKKDQFSPIQRIVYGAVAAIVLTVLGAILNTTLLKH
jgi:Skp family chaperone for outer membrane proteins